MAEYDDKSYYEIQLEQKQLVLILLLMVGICILFFFLGVYYVKGRDGGMMAQATPAAPVEKTGLKAPEGPDKVETEQVSRFFEKDGGSKENAPKADYEGGKVIAESQPTDVTPTKGHAGKGDATPPPATPRAPVKGTEPTMVAAPPSAPRTEPAHAEAPAHAAGGFVIQIAALKDEDRANKVVSDLKSKGFHAYLTPDGDLYKIRVGPYSERDKADQAKDGLKSVGYGEATVRSD